MRIEKVVVGDNVEFRYYNDQSERPEFVITVDNDRIQGELKLCQAIDLNNALLKTLPQYGTDGTITKKIDSIIHEIGEKAEMYFSATSEMLPTIKEILTLEMVLLNNIQAYVQSFPREPVGLYTLINENAGKVVYLISQYNDEIAVDASDLVTNLNLLIKSLETEASKVKTDIGREFYNRMCKDDKGLVDLINRSHNQCEDFEQKGQLLFEICRDSLNKINDMKGALIRKQSAKLNNGQRIGSAIDAAPPAYDQINATIVTKAIEPSAPLLNTATVSQALSTSRFTLNGNNSPAVQQCRQQSAAADNLARSESKGSASARM